MARHTLPGMGLTGAYDTGDDGWTAEMNDNLMKLSVASQLVVESMTTALPGSPTNGLIYIVPTAGGNQWKIAVRDAGAWVYLTPITGWIAYVKDADKQVRWTGSAWADLVSGGSVGVRDEGSTIVAAAAALNFEGAGVTVTDTGSGVAKVTISGGASGGSANALEAPFTPPPAAATWGQQNFHSTNTFLEDFSQPVSGLRLREAIVAYGNTNAIRYALRPIPGAAWRATARLRRHTRLTSWHGFGLAVRDSANGRSVLSGFIHETQSGIGSLQMTNDNSYASVFNFGGSQYPWRNDFWIRLEYNGTDCLFYISLDGVYWSLAKKHAGTALWGFLTNPATHVGFGYNSNNAGGADIPNEVDLLSWNLVALP